MELTLQLLVLLFAVAMIAGFVDAIAGGGGLLTIPALLLSGMSPVQALATNKLQSSAGSLSASITMIKKGLVNPRTLKLALATAFIGSAIGTILVQLSAPEMLRKVLPFLIGAVGLYTLLSPKLGQLPSTPKISQRTYDRYVSPVLGFYDGYFGPAVGTFFSLSHVVLIGYQLVQATARAKLLNFATNLASVIFFVLGGQVVWAVGLTMACGQALGAYLGSHMVVKGGAKFVRPIIVLMCFAMLIKLVLAG